MIAPCAIAGLLVLFQEDQKKLGKGIYPGVRDSI